MAETSVHSPSYVLQARLVMDFMTIAASSAEIWWNTLDCPMMNAEIPDDATPAPPHGRYRHDIALLRDVRRLSAEAPTTVDDMFADMVRHDFGHQPLADMGLMAETTYYYRVSATRTHDRHG